jgi:hypothetical protein
MRECRGLRAMLCLRFAANASSSSSVRLFKVITFESSSGNDRATGPPSPRPGNHGNNLPHIQSGPWIKRRGFKQPRYWLPAPSLQTFSLESDVRAEGDSEVVVRSVVEIDLISDI